MKIDLGIVAFWAVVMLGITALSGRAAALWFAVGWLGASVFALWEAGRKKRGDDHRKARKG